MSGQNPFPRPIPCLEVKTLRHAKVSFSYLKSVPVISLSLLKMFILFLSCMFLVWISLNHSNKIANPTQIISKIINTSRSEIRCYQIMTAAPVSSSAMEKSSLFCSFPSGNPFNTWGLYQLFLQFSFRYAPTGMWPPPPHVDTWPVLFNSQACIFGYIWIH